MSSEGQANLADFSVNARKLLDIKNVEDWTQSGQGNKKQCNIGSQFCSRVSENEGAILNIDNMVSLVHQECSTTSFSKNDFYPSTQQINISAVATDQ